MMPQLKIQSAQPEKSVLALPDFMEAPPTQQSNESLEIKPLDLKVESTQSTTTQVESSPQLSCKKPALKMKTVYLPLDKRMGYFSNIFAFSRLGDK